MIKSNFVFVEQDKITPEWQGMEYISRGQLTIAVEGVCQYLERGSC